MRELAYLSGVVQAIAIRLYMSYCEADLGRSWSVCEVALVQMGGLPQLLIRCVRLCFGLGVLGACFVGATVWLSSNELSALTVFNNALVLISRGGELAQDTAEVSLSAFLTIFSTTFQFRHGTYGLCGRFSFTWCELCPYVNPNVLQHLDVHAKLYHPR